jgi:riboflavin-specific deaminase-like protein
MDANLHLGLPVDARDYSDGAAVLTAMGVRRVRLITNNPQKAEALLAAGIEVEAIREIATAASRHNVTYLRTKQTRLGHVQPLGRPLDQATEAPPDVSTLLGDVPPFTYRPYVILKYAQSMDGRIATASGDSKWITGDEERTISHALRAGCDAVMVGVGTVLRDDPQLTVRLVPGSSPLRVVLDSTLRLPLDARVLADDAPTLVLTTAAADPARRRELQRLHIAVREVPGGPAGVGLAAALGALRAESVGSVLVEGGARMITSLLDERLVDRLIVGIAPKILGSGTEGVADLGIDRIRDGIRLGRRSIYAVGDDVLLAWDVIAPDSEAMPAGRIETAARY